MDSLIILPKEDTPSVVFDKSAGLFEISGLSLPENACEFYNPIIAWLEEYAENPNPKTIINFNFKYFNTSSAKKIIKLLSVLGNIHISEKNTVQVIWYYNKDDEDAHHLIEKYRDISNLPIVFKTIE